MDAWLQQFPLRASGRHIVNKHGERFKFSGVNWYGASDSYHVVGGLAMRSLQDICETIASMGFTVVRLPFSNEMLRVREVQEGAIDYTLNPELRGLSPLEVHDQVVHELGRVHVAVVLNNHTIIGMWSGGVEANGLWFLEGSETYTEAAWIDDWLTMASRYRHQPHVVAYDIRNEVRPTGFLSSESRPTWGGGGACDWARAAGNCATALIGANEGDGLIIVERMAWPQESLREMLSPPPWERWRLPRDRIVLALHMYSWSGPGHWSPKFFTNAVVGSILHAVDYARNSSLYGELGEKELFEQLDQDFGFCLDEDICPVWLSEFGADLKIEGQIKWFEKMCRYMEQKDVDFAYWPLNVGDKPATDEDEAYGILTNDWKPRWADCRLQAMRRLMESSTALSPSTSPARQRNRGLSNMGYPLTPAARLRANTVDSVTSPSMASPSTPESCEATRDRLLTLSPIFARRTASEDSSRHGREDCPLVLALHPWCHPLPGPLLPWSDELHQETSHIPEARYLWTVLHGMDADPGSDAQILGGSADELKTTCIQGGFGAFVFFEGRGYMRTAPAEALQTRLVPSPKSVIFLAQEVRLCAVWTVFEAEVLLEHHYKAVASEDNPCSLVSVENADELIHECQRACLERDFMGFEICSDDGCSARLLRERELNAAPADGTLKSFLEDAGYSMPSPDGVRRDSVSEDEIGFPRAKIHSELSVLKQLHVLESSPVCIGLEAHPDMDAFPGNNVWVSESTSLAECRELCLQSHYGGFAIHRGKAYFRTATDTVLRKHLQPGFSDTVFYILTARELEAKDLPPGVSIPAPEERDLIARCVKSRLTEALLPFLWHPRSRQRARTYSKVVADINGHRDEIPSEQEHFLL